MHPFYREDLNSAFITYDFIRQIQRLDAGDREALAAVIGDSLMLGTDVTGATIEALVSLNFLPEGVLAFAGPAGELIIALVIGWHGNLFCCRRS